MKHMLVISILVTSLLCHAQYQGGTGGGGVISCSASFQVLPVELIHFTAIAKGQEVLLEWTTATEHDNAGFHVERSADGVHFEAIMEIPGMGTSLALTQYEAVDRSPLPGLGYYRLRQTDLDGTTTISDVVSVTMELPEIRAFPNPVRDLLTLHGASQSGPQVVELSDQLGRIVVQQVHPEGPVQVDMQLYPAGVYHVRLSWGSSAKSWKVVKE